METLDVEVPLARKLGSIALLYNLKKGVRALTPDAEAEYDSIDTVHAIRTELEKAGLSVELIEADRDLPERLRECRADIAFNIAEGLSGRAVKRRFLLFSTCWACRSPARMRPHWPSRWTRRFARNWPRPAACARPGSRWSGRAKKRGGFGFLSSSSPTRKVPARASAKRAWWTA